jgi:hypothetical protein
MRRVLFLLLVCLVLVLAPELALLVGRPHAGANIAAEAEISSSNTIGHLDCWLVRGPVSDEGSSWHLSSPVLLGSWVGVIHLDFGEPRDIGALLIQADHDDEYAVDASLDASTWNSIWYVPVEAGPGFRTRHRILTEPIRARYLRVRNNLGAYGGISAISAIRVYSEVPNGWPRPADVSAAEPPLAFPWLSLRGVKITKVVFACGGAFLIISFFFLNRSAAEGRRKRAAKRLLVLVSMGAALGWWNFFQFKDQEFARIHRNYWDVYHYYIGSKYSTELRHTNQYRCLLAADVEDGFRRFHLSRPATRDLSTNDFVRTQQVLAESARCKGLFSAERWAEYKRDHAWFRSHVPPIGWLNVPYDHGYNASPVWAILGGTLSNLVPISTTGFVLLISIDTILFVVMWYMAWSTFGWRATCVALLFWSTNLVAGNASTAAAFLRNDWLCLTVVGVCCLKREKMALAGFLLVYAALLRVFPGFLLVGIAFKALVDMIGRRSFTLSRQHRSLALGATIGFVLLVALSFATAGRTTVWTEFMQNTSKHRETPKVQDMGMRALVAHMDQGELLEQERVSIVVLKASYARPERRLVVIALSVFFLPLLLAAVAGEEDWVAAILGITWLPFISDITNYYWAVLLVFALLLVRKEIVGLGFAALTVPFAALGLMYGELGLGMPTWGSLAMILFFLWVSVSFATPKWWSRSVHTADDKVGW